MRNPKSYNAKYGPTTGTKLLGALQKEAAYASVAARYKKKIALLRKQLRDNGFVPCA